jgi:hypothetical protein
MISNKEKTRELAKEFWRWCGYKKSGIGICDWCNVSIQKGEGYIINPHIQAYVDDLSHPIWPPNFPDFVCEQCFFSKGHLHPKAWDAGGHARTIEEAKVALRNFFGIEEKGENKPDNSK